MLPPPKAPPLGDTIHAPASWPLVAVVAVVVVVVVVVVLLLTLRRQRLCRSAPEMPIETLAHDAMGRPEAEQERAAAVEAALMAHAPRGASMAVPPERAGAALRADGIARVDGALTADVADSLLRHANKRLDEAQRRAGGDGESLLGALLCRRARHDLKLDLREPSVAAALEQALATVGPALASALGSGAALFELGALFADPGAARQPVHPDTPWSERPAVATAFFALQDTTERMGSTLFLPRTHDAPEAQEAYLYGQPVPWGAAAPCEMADLLGATEIRMPLLQQGDGVLFDARTLHCGGANESERRRVLFFVSFRGAGRGAAWRGGGFDAPGTLLNELRGRFVLSRTDRGLAPREPTCGPTETWMHAWMRMYRALKCGCEGYCSSSFSLSSFSVREIRSAAIEC